jgi:hypothetical protein
MRPLSFEQAPPACVPARFFLTAPLFGVLAGVLLMFHGTDALTSRWAPSTLALTHLFTTGFMLQTMCGALMQFVPVAAGGNIWRPRLIGGLVHPSLCAATLLFVAGFLSGRHALLDGAAVLFAGALGIQAIAVGAAVFRTVGVNPTVMALRLAIGALIVTVVTGVLLVQILRGRIALPMVETTHVHAGWGLVGWAGVLVIGVGYFVIPMFQMTAPFPRWLQKSLAPALLLALLVWSTQLSASIPPAASGLALAAILAGGALFAATTLLLQARRKRKISDPTLVFFRIAMICVMAVVLVFAVSPLAPGGDDSNIPALLLGILILQGVFGSVICGMLYKILPFMLWMNLQRIDPALATKVSTRKLLSEAPMMRHLGLHVLTLPLLLLAAFIPALVRPAGLLLVVAYGWLEWNLLVAWSRYRDHHPDRAGRPEVRDPHR